MKKILSIVTLSLIIFCGIVFAGCDPGDSSLLLSFGDSRVEILSTEEYKQFDFYVNGQINSDLSFDFSFEQPLASVVENSLQSISSGKYSVKIKPIAVGETKLTVSIRGMGTSLSVPVFVSEEIKGITAKDNVYIKRGTTRAITSADFVFNPDYTTQTKLLFSLENQYELERSGIHWDSATNSLTVDESSSGVNIVSILATSATNTDITATLTVKIVNGINVDSLGLNITSLCNDQTDVPIPATLKTIYPNSADGEQKLEFTINDAVLFKKEISVSLNSFNEVMIDVFAEGEISGDLNKNSPIKEKQSNFSFNVQTNAVTGKNEYYKLIVRVYQADFTANYKDVEILVVSKMVPNEIRVNGTLGQPTINLFDNNSVSKSIVFTTYPDITNSYNYEDYHMSFKFYKTSDNAVLSDSSKIDFNEFSKYANLLLNGENLSAYDNVDKLLSNILAREVYFNVSAKKALDENLAIVASCIDKNGVAVCTNVAFIKVFVGSKAFGIDTTKYANSTLYVKMPNSVDLKTTYEFNDFMLSGGSVGRIYVTPKFSTSLSCDVAVDLGKDTPTLLITPKTVGKSEFIINTENDLPPITIAIVVYREISEDDFSLALKNVDSNYIYNYVVNETTGSIKEFTIKGIGNQATIVERINNYSDTNSDSYRFELELANNSNFALNKSTNTITSSNFADKESVTVRLVRYVANEENEFIRDEVEDAITFNFNISCTDYVLSINLTTSNDNLDEQSNSAKKLKTIDVYNYNELSFVNKNLATAKFYLDVELSSGNISTLSELNTNGISFGFDNISCSLGSLEVVNETTLKVKDVGYLSLAGEGDFFVAYFTCKYDAIFVEDSFSFTINLTDKLNNTFISTINIKIKNYIDVEGIFLVNGIDTIYLDNTENNRQVTLTTYVLPTNAMLTDVLVSVEYADAKSANCVTYTTKGNTVTFSYIKGGSGTIRLFPVSVMKTNSERDEYGNYYHHIAIDFISADGEDESTALKISSYADLKNFDSSKHYYLDSLIDCGGEELCLGELNKTIRGTFHPASHINFNESAQLGGIINFVVSGSGANRGLFETINGDAKAYNLLILANFDKDALDNLATTTYVGLFAGTNNGTITDVQVGLHNSQDNDEVSISKNQDISANVALGMLVGLNKGTISIENAKNSTLLVDMSSTSLKVIVKDDSLRPETYLGGVAGQNDGLIKNEYISGTFSSVGLFGVNAYVNIIANVNYLGSVVGRNITGTVDQIVAMGTVRNNYASDEASFVGGLIGYMDGGTLNGTTSRVFVRGKGIACGLIGQIKNDATITAENNKVQAIDDGSKRGIDATLVYSYNSKANSAFSLVYDEAKLTAGNCATTYMLYSRNKITSVNNINNNLSFDYYYGDVLVIDENEGVIINRDNDEMGDGSSEINIGSTSINTTLAISAFKKAKDASNQSKILNDLNTQELLKLTNISMQEMNIKIDGTTLAMLMSYGKTIRLNGTCESQITVSSALNYKAYVKLNVYFTEYFKDIALFTDKDYLDYLKSLTLINEQTKAIYIKSYTNYFTVKNERIELEENKQIDYKITANSDYINILTNGQMAYVSAKPNTNQNNVEVTLKPVMVINNMEYFGIFVDDLGAHAFYLTDINDGLSKTFNAKIVTGIQDISADRTYIMAEPSDEVLFNLNYTTYNKDNTNGDKISVRAYLQDGKAENKLGYEKDNTDGSITFNLEGTKLFTLEKTTLNEDEIESNIYSVKEGYRLYLNLSPKSYEIMKNATIKLCLYSELTNEEIIITITYSPETITAVLINNYSYEENSSAVTTLGKTKVFNNAGMINASQYASTGEQNLLKAYVYTKYGEFDYVEVTMNLNAPGGYMALAKEFEEGGQIKYRASYDAVVLANDTNVTLRIYRDDLISSLKDFYNEDEKTLCITIIYSLPVTYNEDDRAEIDFYFYKTENRISSLIYTKATSVIAKSTKKVEFAIYGKTADISNDPNYNVEYKVAKGKAYPLEVTVSGFNDSEIVFESSNANVARIENIGGIYYLIVSDTNIPYANKEYYSLVLTSYGVKNEGNVISKSVEYRVKLCVYELLLDDDLFDSDTLRLRVLDSVDIREVVSDMLKMEYANTVVRENFVSSFKQKSTFFIQSQSSRVVFDNGVHISGNDFAIDGFNFKPLTITDSASYTLGVTYRYSYLNGTPTCDTNDLDGTVYSGTIIFNVVVYFNSSEKLPMPISNYSELLQVQNGEYYRMVSDITIDSDQFEVIKTSPKSFDGNGYTINIIGTTLGYELSDLDGFGLFKQINSGCVVKNVKLALNSQMTLRIENYNLSSTQIGLICAYNYGSITNCEVVSNYNLNVNIITSSTNMENSYFGGIASQNNGFITNSRMLANVTVSGASVGGFVANNIGKISSSYVKGVKISNKSGSTNDNIVTGGFVANNDGEISMCYIEGKQGTDYIFCNYVQGDYSIESKIIDTTSAVAGFVYNNNGKVLDSYANIPISSSSKTAGFVGNNNGTIKRVYSLCKLEIFNTIKYAFVISKTNLSVFEDCFFIIETGVINYGTSETNYTLTAGKYESKIDGVVPLQRSDFKEYSETFKNFIVSDDLNDITNGVWFYVKDSNITNETMPYMLNAKGFETYDIDEGILKPQAFVANRLQLVSPNLIASQRYNLDMEHSANLTGKNYAYTIDNPIIAYGSAKNPYIIADANDMELYLNQNIKNKKEYYRLVADIDYIADEVFASKLFSKTLVAYFEGNNLNVYNYSINSSVGYSSAGLLATIGESSSSPSVIKNVNLKPYYINLPNCNYVGALAGTLINSRIYNVSVDSPDIVIIGNNIVGGIFGRTIGSNHIECVYSNTVARATQYSSALLDNKDNINKALEYACYLEKETRKGIVSYSGAIVGYLGGMTEVIKPSIGENTKVYGVVSGLMFGGIGSFASVNQIMLNMNSYDNSISALAFGGMVAGENRGEINNVSINSNIVIKNLFNVSITRPIAIGGIVGIMPAGTINGVNSETGYSVIGAAFTGRYGFMADGALKEGCAYDNILNTYVVKHVGGVVGYAKAGEISNISIGQNHIERIGEKTNTIVDSGLIILGGNYVGGIAGLVENGTEGSLALENITLNFVSHKNYIHENGNEFDEIFYTQYISEAGYTALANIDFDEHNYFGLLVGFAQEGSIEIGTLIIDFQDIYLYYGKYGIKNAIGVTGNYVGNTDYYGSIEDGDLSNIIHQETYDLTTGTKVLTE